MIIEIHSHGGFGGLGAARPLRIDTDQQPDARRRALCDAFCPDHLARLQAAACPRCNDRMRYAITVTTEAAHSFTLSEGQLPPEMLDLIDDA